MHAHPRHPATEARPAAVAPQRSADGGSPRLHARDARPLVQFLVLDGIDLVDEIRCGSSSLNRRPTFARVDQRNTGTVDAGNGIGGELGDLAQQLEHAAGAGHHPGQRRAARRAGRLRPLPVARWTIRLLWRFATGLGVVVPWSSGR